VGVENASPQVIRQALENAKAQEAVESSYQVEDLLHLGLLSGPGARERRRQVGEALGIGYANAKQFISRIRAYGITQEQLLRAIEKVDGHIEVIEER
jgi:ribonuclease M5